ncbi:hypothetical protein [Luteolibacter luteus]|uniref:Uncharacterized protein n=1 Tax=Luteolibacter luteus TaxID=2728835 RepID=A0A858RJ64_9BACT|nr:hypothetical protein [Luteolibacter luteus]QJE96459.1 hypothetical protein HHL09_11915 [Luteolibacter luteus]
MAGSHASHGKVLFFVLGLLAGCGISYLVGGQALSPVSGTDGAGRSRDSKSVDQRPVEKLDRASKPAERREDDPIRTEKVLFALKGGEATAYLRRELGLSDEHVIALKEAHRAAKDELEKKMISMMRRDPVFDDPRSQTFGYRIDSFELEGERIASAYLEALKASGVPEAKMIAESFANDPSLLGAGKADVVLRLTPDVVEGEPPPEILPKDSWRVAFELQNPATGQSFASGTRSMADFNRLGYRLFDTTGSAK